MSKKPGKTVTAVIKLVIKAGQAKPAPPVGPALGQAGLNIMSFCKDFNAKTAGIKDDVPVPVSIKAYSDKTYEYVRIISIRVKDHVWPEGLLRVNASQYPEELCASQVTKTPPVTFFVKKALELKLASQNPGHQSAGSISPQQVFEIAQIKQGDSPHVPLESICKSVVGTCRSMGIQVA